MNTKQTAVRIPDDLREQLVKLSDSSDLSVSQLVIACIRRALPYVEAKVNEQASKSE